MRAAARAAMDGKAKPPGSMGLLEDWAVRLAELQGTLAPRVATCCLLLFAADHGVTREQPAVSAYPREVTPAMFGAIARGQAVSSALCRANSIHLEVVDVGIDIEGDEEAQGPGKHADAEAGAGAGAGAPGAGPAGAAAEGEAAAATARGGERPRPLLTAVRARVARGSASFLSGPAMTEGECEAAIQAGAAAVARACERAAAEAAEADAAAAEAAAAALLAAGVDDDCGTPAAAAPWRGLALGVGELGIGNTTAAAALVAALTGARPAAVVGRGTGVGDAGLAAKTAAVAAALAANAALIKEGGALCALRAVGGLELAAMTGAYLEAGRRRLPVVVDGFISGAAALAAARHDPSILPCLFASHASAEAGAAAVLEALGLRAPLHMGMRLGEGTGAALALPLLRSAAALMTDVASLAEVMAAGGAGPA
ncbi:nicotinate-nucleotide-dimethylbenzimidazole phosphoribosyltransferase [Raphidocelis subcapitata]|uniref:Nicotinate-nucleotide--dimethylbenzimidazole phosphoribosyltransferase n=1 Tax=Raphidocelis subcapitata TaxID=307507 RepID=A0A2V0NM61_9CHLO|nr:nicotinate-nucleotide-dimethylbenzimidazole phosphoribosyltransferase [Raphidocelis subcapitata]|eukprot:GBF88556.1 nicotinate-nucleotide-dimethylbenzimidazole phosphoribosyltransferase [Raphidocelis subcapitata]